MEYILQRCPFNNEFEYLSEFEVVRKNALRCETGAQWRCFLKKPEAK
jgi:hypothetical protein